MNKWFVIGGLLLVVSWLPFLVGEWSRSDAVPVQDELAVRGTDEPTPREPVVPKPLAAELPPPEPAADVPEHEAEEDEPLHEDGEEQGEPEEADDEEADDDDGAKPTTVINSADMTTRLKEAFEAETRDSLWAKARESTLLQMAEHGEVRLRGEDAIRCQRTVCRVAVEVTGEESSRMMAFYSAILRDLAPSEGQPPPTELPDRALGIDTLETGSDKTVLDIYVSREGYHNIVPK